MGAPGHARVRIKLELELGDAPIRGRIGAAGDDDTPFSGWLELIAALERIRGADAPRGKVFGALHDAVPGPEGDT